LAVARRSRRCLRIVLEDRLDVHPGMGVVVTTMLRAPCRVNVKAGMSGGLSSRP